MVEWSPTQYARFERERTQPARDLLARVEGASHRRVVDLGCGPGNSTALLAERFADAEVLGVDSSPAMIERARARLPGARLEVRDLLPWSAAPSQQGAWDLVFSNAALQWVSPHPQVFAQLAGCLREGGTLAVQMPRNHAAPTHTCIAQVAQRSEWSDRLRGAALGNHVYDAGAYHDMLSGLVAELSVWETIYQHAFDSPEAIVQWTLGSALAPYLEPLDAGEEARFLQEYRELIAEAYPPRETGQVLMPFRRLFLLAVR